MMVLWSTNRLTNLRIGTARGMSIKCNDGVFWNRSSCCQSIGLKRQNEFGFSSVEKDSLIDPFRETFPIKRSETSRAALIKMLLTAETNSITFSLINLY